MFQELVDVMILFFLIKQIFKEIINIKIINKMIIKK